MWQNERKRTWHDMFYDLLFVVAVSKVGEGFQSLQLESTASPLANYAALFLPMFSQWFLTQTYLNRFDARDLYHSAFFFVNVLLVAGMCLNIESCVHGHSSTLNNDCRDFSLFYAPARFLHAVMHVRVALFLARARVYAASRAAVSLLVAVFFLAAALSGHANNAAFLALWWSAVIFDYVAQAALAHLPRHLDIPLNLDLFDERMGIFVIISLSETLIAGSFRASEGALPAGHAHGAHHTTAHPVLDPMVYLYAFLLTTVTLFLKFLYLDIARSLRLPGAVHAIRRWPWASTLYAYAHVPFLMCVLTIGHVLKYVVVNSALNDSLRWTLCGSLAISMLMCTVLQNMHKTNHPLVLKRHIPRLVKLGVRCGSGVIILLLPVMIPESTSPAVLLGITAAVLAGNSLVDIYDRRALLPDNSSRDQPLLDSSLQFG